MARIRDIFLGALTPSRTVRPWKDTLAYLMVALTVVPGYFAFASGELFEKIVLSTVTAVGVVLFLALLAQSAFEARLRVLTEEKQELVEEFRRYKVQSESERSILAEAVDYTVATQVYFYEESLEIEVHIGVDNDSDRIIERHTTRPAPNNFPAERPAVVPFRRFRPIISSDLQFPITFADLQLRSRLANGNPIDLKVFSLMETRQAITVFAKFTPALMEQTTWIIEYISPGLWDSLRRENSDHLAWDVGGAGSRHSPFSRLTLHFIFPPDTVRMSVREIHGEGDITERTRTLGPCQTWVENNPEARKFRWEISYTRAT